jgi:hypothetical protein
MAYSQEATPKNLLDNYNKLREGNAQQMAVVGQIMHGLGALAHVRALQTHYNALNNHYSAQADYYRSLVDEKLETAQIRHEDRMAAIGEKEKEATMRYGGGRKLSSEEEREIKEAENSIDQFQHVEDLARSGMKVAVVPGLSPKGKGGILEPISIDPNTPEGRAVLNSISRIQKTYQSRIGNLRGIPIGGGEGGGSPGASGTGTKSNSGISSTSPGNVSPVINEYDSSVRERALQNAGKTFGSTINVEPFLPPESNLGILARDAVGGARAAKEGGVAASFDQGGILSETLPPEIRDRLITMPNVPDEDMAILQKRLQ